MLISLKEKRFSLMLLQSQDTFDLAVKFHLELSNTFLLLFLAIKSEKVETCNLFHKLCLPKKMT